MDQIIGDTDNRTYIELLDNVITDFDQKFQNELVEIAQDIDFDELKQEEELDEESHQEKEVADSQC